MAEDSPPTTIAARIAALQLDQVNRQKELVQPLHSKVRESSVKLPPTIPAKRPEINGRHKTANVPVLGAHTAGTFNEVGNLPSAPPTMNGAAVVSVRSGEKTPPLPSRPASRPPQASPPLPARRPSEQSAPALPPRKQSDSPSLPPRRPSEYSLPRRGSNESTSSAVSGRSSVSAMSSKTAASSRTSSSARNFTIRAPAYDPSSLPPLPPKRQKDKSERPRAALTSSRSSPVVASVADVCSASEDSSEPPPLPTRRDPSQQLSTKSPHSPLPGRSALSWGMNKAQAPPLPATRPDLASGPSASSPPIPTSTRPDLARLQATKPRPCGPTLDKTCRGSCLICRDFSAVDLHASQQPPQPLQQLAHALTSPFPSPTDKARAIFTWLHHNIAYDVVAFHTNVIAHSTPASTLTSGLAVCEGYAGLFAALAACAGLEAVVIGGHGKGFGYAALGPGAPLPPFKSGHAWNAVRIDGGVWKLVDACWGAGYVTGAGAACPTYTRKFTPDMFTMSNQLFGWKHYPADRDRLYREDGRADFGWEEYLRGELGGAEEVKMWAGFVREEGIEETSFLPRRRLVSLMEVRERGVVRFQFGKVCEHWDNVKNGPGLHYIYVLTLSDGPGVARRAEPFQTDGNIWWVDARPEDLGGVGQTVRITAMTNVDGRDARGLTIQQFRDKYGKVGMAGGVVADWEIVA